VLVCHTVVYHHKKTLRILIFVSYVCWLKVATESLARYLVTVGRVLFITDFLISFCMLLDSCTIIS